MAFLMMIKELLPFTYAKPSNVFVASSRTFKMHIGNKEQFLHIMCHFFRARNFPINNGFRSR